MERGSVGDLPEAKYLDIILYSRQQCGEEYKVRSTFFFFFLGGGGGGRREGEEEEEEEECLAP